jgi:hypothetical protein
LCFFHIYPFKKNYHIDGSKLLGILVVPLNVVQRSTTSNRAALKDIYNISQIDLRLEDDLEYFRINLNSIVCALVRTAKIAHSK